MKIEDLHHIYKECGSISTDTRKLIPGSVFFALRGENFDGNKYALEAVEKGCAYAVVDDMSLVRHPSLLQFNDVLDTLQKLANYHRNQFKKPVLAITGTNGKTTTKELISAVLSRKYKVCATQGNLNNHIGVPLTLLSIKDHDIAIIEMGANHIGEIKTLCRIAEPDFGLITNIGKAHLEGFGSPEGVIIAKSELYDYIAGHSAKVFIDSGNALLMRLAKERNLEILSYGMNEESFCSGEILGNTKFLQAKISFTGLSETIDVQSKLVGDYNLNNILAAACIGNYFGVKPSDIETALCGYEPSNSRSQMMVTPKNKIVLDAYNANPSSMEGSIANFLAMTEEFPKMLILGDMLELGKYSHEEHISIIELLKNKQINKLYLVGPEFCAATGSASMNCFRKVDDLIEHLRVNPVKEHSILLKGSRGIKLEKLLEVL